MNNSNMLNNSVIIDKRADGVALVIINKPARRNALDPHLMDDLTDAFQTLDDDNEVKVIILKGQGDHFSSGGDLKAIEPGPRPIEEKRKMLRRYARTIQAIQNMDKPVIAMVKGYAVGGGMSLALACDLILASEDARFSCNFLKVGIVPEMGAMLFLPQALGLYRAKDLWFTGRIVEAAEARAMGFVNQVFPSEEIEAATISLAQELALLPSVSLRITKRIANATVNHMLNTILDCEAQSSPFCSESDDHKAYVESFRHKKKASENISDPTA
jgi:2-(1,2-epoxy-1,2-dihydrophenyl)acetyl-CoA isomerase